MKKFLLNTAKYFIAAALASLLMGAVAVSADNSASYWTQTAPQVLMTTPGGLANADIHVRHCYIGTGTGTPCSAGGGGGVTSLNSLTGALSIVAGTGINVTPSGSNITITNTGGSITCDVNQIPFGTGVNAIGCDPNTLTWDNTAGILNVEGPINGARINLNDTTRHITLGEGVAEDNLDVNLTNSTVKIGDVTAFDTGKFLNVDEHNSNLIWNAANVSINGAQMVWPSANAAGILTNNGSGTLTWASGAPASSITVGTTTVGSGTNGYVLYDNAGTLGNLQVSTTSIDSTLVSRDANGNSGFNNAINNLTSTVGGGGTVSLTNASSQIQVLTGTTTGKIYNLPDATTLATGWKFEFQNTTSGAPLFIHLNDGTTDLVNIVSGQNATVTCTGIGTTNGTWTYTVTSNSGATAGDILVSDGTKFYATPMSGDVTINSSGATTIGANAVTYAKFQQVAAVSLVGNPTGGLANAEGITLGSGLSFSGTILTATGSGGTVTSIATTSPITGGTITGTGTIGISNAAADGTTKGAATFTAADFNDNGSGLISIDYTNGQKASGSQPGFLSSTDWNTFNGKLSSTLTSAHIFVGNGSNVATGVAMSGDVSITNAGATTVGAINGVALGTTTATNQAVLIANGTNWSSHTLSGDVSITNTGATTVNTVNGGAWPTQAAGVANLTGQNGSNANVLTVTAAATANYRISSYIQVTTAGGGSAALSMTVAWTDENSTNHSITYTGSIPLTTSGTNGFYSNGIPVIRAKTGTNIVISSTYTAGTGSPVWDLGATIERISSN